MSRKIVELGEISNVTKLAGYEFTKHITYNNDGEIIALRALNLSVGQLDLTNIKRIGRSVSEELPRSKLHKGDVLLSYTGTVGNYAIIEKDDVFHLAPNVCRIRASEKCIPEYLYYVVASPYFQNELISYNHGSTQATVPMKNIRKIKVPLPDIVEQQRIVKILKPIDDKIKLNRKMNETLEQIGQALFKKFFIDNPEVDSWKTGNLTDITFVNKSTLGKDFAAEYINYIDISAVGIGSLESCQHIKLSDAPSRAKRLVIAGDILWSTVRPNRRAFVRLGSLKANTVASTGFVVLSPKNNCSGYVYYHTTNQSFTDYLMRRAKGAAYPAVLASDFSNAPISIPPDLVLTEFDSIVKPILESKDHLMIESEKLFEIRDLLLPRLMSGQIEI